MSESELIKRLKTGDRDAFNELVLLYQTKVINIAYGMLSDPDDAMDASQEVFVNVYKNINSFRENSSLSTWIYRICANVCKDFLRKRQRRGTTISIYTDPETDPEPANLRDSSPSPEEVSENNELIREIREAMSELSEEFRTVLVLCDIEGLSYEEISKILSCPAGTVKSRINRARAALRKKISQKRNFFD